MKEARILAGLEADEEDDEDEDEDEAEDEAEVGCKHEPKCFM